MCSFRSFITLLIFSLSVIAHSENPEEYIIEVIVFEQLEIIGNEKLMPQDINLINLETISLLEKPDIVLNEKTILKSFDGYSLHLTKMNHLLCMRYLVIMGS
jgi:hypothetical protein